MGYELHGLLAIGYNEIGCTFGSEQNACHKFGQLATTRRLSVYRLHSHKGFDVIFNTYLKIEFAAGNGLTK